MLSPNPGLLDIPPKAVLIFYRHSRDILAPGMIVDILETGCDSAAKPNLPLHVEQTDYCATIYPTIRPNLCLTGIRLEEPLTQSCVELSQWRGVKQ